MEGQIIGIYIANEKSAPMQSIESVEAIAELGLLGDRYHSRQGTFSKSEGKPRDITLIESEAAIALKSDYDIEIDPRELRRNILTKGIALNHFVGRNLHIGSVIVTGIELCEPCGYLENLVQKPVKNALKHRGGLRARIVHGGTLSVGDKITG